MPQFLYMLYTSGAINQVYGMLIIGLFLTVVWQYFRIGRVNVNGIGSKGFWMLFAFGMLYFIMSSPSLSGIGMYLVCPLIAYVVGWVTVEAGRDAPEKTVRSVIYFMVLGYLIHVLLNYFANIGNARWNLIDFYTKSRRAATGSGTLNTMIFSLCVYTIALEKNKAIKLAAIVGTIFSLMYSVMLGTRTQLAIFAIVSVVFLLIYFREKYGRTSAVRTMIIVAVIVAVGFYMYGNNVLGLRSAIESSNLAARYTYQSGTADSDAYRLSSLWEGIKNMFQHPLGGQGSRKYFHNMWLDIARIGGIIPFAAMLAYTILINVHAIKILRNNKIEAWFRYLVFCIYLGVQLNFFTEPVLEGMIGFFLTFTVINGMVEAYCRIEEIGYTPAGEGG